MAINIVEMLGITYDECVIGNLIVGLINNSNNFRKSFLQHIIGIKKTGQYKVHAITKVGTSNGVPDIIIMAESMDKVIVSFIDCKLRADRGYNQVFVYSDEACKSEILPLFDINLNNRNFERKFICLSVLDPDENVSKECVKKTFKDLVEKVWVDIEDEVLDRIYKDFGAKIIEFYSNSHLIANHKLIDIISNDEDNEKIFIKFREIVLSLDKPKDVKLAFFSKSSCEKDFSFIFKLTKNEWSGREARWNGNEYEMDVDTFDVHIEGKIDITKRIIKLAFHYETNPYITRGNLMCHCTARGYISFENRREEVKERVRKLIEGVDDTHITAYDGVNGLLHAEYIFHEDITVCEFKKLLSYYIMEISNIIDKALL